MERNQFKHSESPVFVVSYEALQEASCARRNRFHGVAVFGGLR